MGIVIGERRLIKEGRRSGEIVGNCVTRTHIHTVCTHMHTNTSSGIRDSLPLCVMALEPDMAEWLS